MTINMILNTLQPNPGKGILKMRSFYCAGHDYRGAKFGSGGYHVYA